MKPRQKVLIVDDHVDTCEGLRHLIRASWRIDEIDLEIVCVHTMADGLREAHDANVTILDLEFPDSPRAETVKRIREFQPPVIVLTGHDDIDLATECMKAGAAHVFVKGTLFGFIPSFFEALQKDVVRRAYERDAAA